MDKQCYIISYQLITPRDVEPLHAAIRAYGTWARITDTTWAVVTSQSAVDVRDHLRSFIGSDDRIFVVKSAVEAAWANAISTNEWLKRNL